MLLLYAHIAHKIPHVYNISLVVMEHNPDIPIHHTLDVSGLICPMPVLKAKKFLKTIHTGEVVKIIATDKAALKDFPVFCEMAHHALLKVQHEGDKIIFCIRK